MKKVFLIGLLFACAGAWAQAPQRVPAYRGLIARVQPNGDTLHIYLRGDEHSHFAMTEDGWQIIENKRGWLKYAKLNRKGMAVISCRKAHDAAKRTKRENKWINKYGIFKGER